MTHIAQLKSEILTIATDVLQKPIVLVNVNDLLIQRIRQEKDPLEVCVSAIVGRVQGHLESRCVKNVKNGSSTCLMALVPETK